ncbi:hypothetical protein ACFSTA_20545 [Ornithinibacillus salinisoli]|uniref:Lipoprotein n=1 Tax=Ornithinibacillus salinisoli TaxID=1848459 RepID=A0ABW4W4J3_9BACI
MKNRTSLTLFFCIFLLLLLGACQKDENKTAQLDEGNDMEEQQEEQNYLYQDEMVKVVDTAGWKKEQENTDDRDNNIVFKNGKVKVILTSVSNERSLDEIKRELKASFGNSEAIEETEQYLSLKTNRKDSVRTDIYLNNGTKQTGIIIFMTPLKDYETNQAIIEEFKQNIQFF